MSGRVEGRLDVEAKGDLALESIFESAGASTPETFGAEGDISRRIAAILDSAQEEAEKMRESARAEAAAVIRAAHASAAERIDDLIREPERIKDKAERAARELIRSAEEDTAKQIAEAHRQAEETIRESEQEAKARRQEADRTVAEMEATIEARKRQLEDELHSLAQLREHAEVSVHEVVEVLQNAASNLDSELGSISDSEHPEHERPSESGKGAFKLLSRRSSEE